MLNREWGYREELPDANAQRTRFAGSRESCLPGGTQILEGTPVLPGTVFGLELLLHEVQIDVGVVTELVLNDVGAVIQILNRAGRVENRMALEEDRIAECLVTLDLRDLLSRFSRCTISRDGEHTNVATVWEHCRTVARYASMIAESRGEIAAEDAYLGGLLDDRGTIGAVLGWPMQSRKRPGAGELLACGEMLPRTVRSAFGREPACRRPKEWKYILDTAHELAGPLPSYAALRSVCRGKHARPGRSRHGE